MWVTRPRLARRAHQHTTKRASFLSSSSVACLALEDTQVCLPCPRHDDTIPSMAAGRGEGEEVQRLSVAGGWGGGGKGWFDGGCREMGGGEGACGCV